MEDDDVDSIELLRKQQEENQGKIVLRWKANQNEIVRFANFVDDERPQYLYLILENERSQLQHLKLVKIQGIEQVLRGN